jgi:MFS superfamily sulfate permease-like transporter
MDVPRISQVILGFTTGSAFLIVGTQLAGMLGITKCLMGDARCDFGLSFVDTVANIVSKIGDVSWISFAYGVICLIFLFAVKKVHPSHPCVLSSPRSPNSPNSPL